MKLQYLLFIQESLDDSFPKLALRTTAESQERGCQVPTSKISLHSFCVESSPGIYQKSQNKVDITFPFFPMKDPITVNSIRRFRIKKGANDFKDLKPDRC